MKPGQMCPHLFTSSPLSQHLSKGLRVAPGGRGPWTRASDIGCGPGNIAKALQERQPGKCPGATLASQGGMRTAGGSHDPHVSLVPSTGRARLTPAAGPRVPQGLSEGDVHTCLASLPGPRVSCPFSLLKCLPGSVWRLLPPHSPGRLLQTQPLLRAPETRPSFRHHFWEPLKLLSILPSAALVPLPAPCPPVGILGPCSF